MKLDILGRKYKVKIIKRHDHEGTVDYGPGVITIDADAKNKRSVLLHEVIHAILWEAGLHHILLGDNKEETIVVALENGLVRAGLFRGKFDL